MRAASAALSLTIHIALGAAVVWRTVDAHARRVQGPLVYVLPVPPAQPLSSRAAVSQVPLPPVPPVVIEGLPSPVIALPAVAPSVPPLPGAVFATTPLASGGPLDLARVEEPPVMLAGPVPTYPELLRQAGIQGRVVLEAVVDTAGRVDPASLRVVASAHPGFVAPAQQALAATLFRPGRMHGRPVPVRVRLPIDFVLREGRLSR